MKTKNKTRGKWVTCTKCKRTFFCISRNHFPTRCTQLVFTNLAELKKTERDITTQTLKKNKRPKKPERFRFHCVSSAHIDRHLVKYYHKEDTLEETKQRIIRHERKIQKGLVTAREIRGMGIMVSPMFNLPFEDWKYCEKVYRAGMKLLNGKFKQTIIFNAFATDEEQVDLIGTHPELLHFFVFPGSTILFMQAMAR